MERFKDLSDDFDLTRAIDEMRSGIATVERMREKNMLLAAALNGVGRKVLPSSVTKEGSYGYIPLDVNHFLDAMLALEVCLAEDPDYQHSEKPHRLCTFLEVGCGIGRNMHLLGATDRFALERICGFDVVPEYVEIGRKLFGLGETIYVDDALTFDYGGFDIIYFYRPFHDDDLQKQFEKRLIETCRRGAYILAQLDSGLDGSRNLVAKNESQGIFKRM